MREAVAVAFEAAGLATIVAGAFVLALWLGLVLLGVALVIVGLGVSK